MEQSLALLSSRNESNKKEKGNEQRHTKGVVVCLLVALVRVLVQFSEWEHILTPTDSPPLSWREATCNCTIAEMCRTHLGRRESWTYEEAELWKRGVGSGGRQWR